MWSGTTTTSPGLTNASAHTTGMFFESRVALIVPLAWMALLRACSMRRQCL
jgi:hypothetical protein